VVQQPRQGGIPNGPVGVSYAKINFLHAVSNTKVENPVEDRQCRDVNNGYLVDFLENYWEITLQFKYIYY